MTDKTLPFKYLDHIDALRAISVILVILFHLYPNIFFFGYLGVDVFFVVSGYVITNSLYEQQIIKKKSIVSFYIKRFKRLYPVLFLVIFTFIVFYILISPLRGNTNFFLGSAITALLGVSNFFFLNNEINYFLNESVNPLLHTWSLGIEEQFYIIYPIFLVTIFKFYNYNLNRIFLSILLLIIISFLIYYFGSDLAGNFYFPISRFWEIALGCSIFFFPKINSKLKLSLIIFFIFLIFVTLLNFDNGKIVKNMNLISTLITALSIIYLKGFETKKVNNLLKKSKLPYVGRLSYSIYLWHLPILYFCEIYFSGLILFIIFFSLTLFLSIVSYHKFETPLRQTNLIENIFSKSKKFAPVFGLLVIIIFFTIKNYKIENLYTYLKKFNYAETKLSNYLSRLDYRYDSYLSSECKNISNNLECYKSSRHNVALYLTGDSHAAHFLPAVDGIKKIDAYFYNGLASCEIILDHLFEVGINTNNCLKNEAKKNFIHKFNNSIYEKKLLIISLRLSEYLKSNWKIINNFDDKDKIVFLKEKYSNFLNKFNAHKVILVTTIPESKIHTEKCIFNEFLTSKINKKIYSQCHFEKKLDFERNKLVRKFLTSISLTKPNIFIYDPYEKLCPNNICHNYNEKNDFFMLNDKDHLSIEASRFLSSDLELFISKIL